MWEIIDYKKEYMQEMLEMTIENYGTGNHICSREFIEHEYFSNPDGNAVIKLAYDYGRKRLAGQYIVIPRTFSVSGDIVNCTLSLNTLTRNEYRGQQVFTKLAEAVYEECRNQKKYFCYGAPNQNSFPGFIKKLGFCNLGSVPLYLKVLNPFWLFCDKRRIPYSYPVSIGKGAGRRTKKHTNIQIVKITDKNVRLFDVFWEKAKLKYPVVGVRDAKHIKWRYLHMPLREYGIYMAIQGNSPCGYVVIRVSEVAGMRCGMVVDFLTDKRNSSAASLLLERAIWEFKRQRTGLVGCLMRKECEEAKYLEKKGFFVCPEKMLPQPFPIILRQFCRLPGNEQECLKDFTHWFFTMGDYDVI